MLAKVRDGAGAKAKDEAVGEAVATRKGKETVEVVVVM